MKKTGFIFLFSLIGFEIHAAKASELQILSRDKKVNLMFQYAKNNDEKHLKALMNNEEIIRDKYLKNALSLALFIVSPIKYKNQFILGYPTENDELWNIIEEVEYKNLTPRFLFSVKSICTFAENGNETAIKKVFLSLLNSDSVVADEICGYIGKIFINNPSATLRELVDIEIISRRKIYICFETLPISENELIKKAINKQKGLDKCKARDQIISEIIQAAKSQVNENVR